MSDMATINILVYIVTVCTRTAAAGPAAQHGTVCMARAVQFPDPPAAGLGIESRAQKAPEKR